MKSPANGVTPNDTGALNTKNSKGLGSTPSCAPYKYHSCDDNVESKSSTGNAYEPSCSESSSVTKIHKESLEEVLLLADETSSSCSQFFNRKTIP